MDPNGLSSFCLDNVLQDGGQSEGMTLAEPCIFLTLFLLRQGLPYWGVILDRPFPFGRNPQERFAVDAAFCQAIRKHVFRVEPIESVYLSVL